VDNDDLCGNPDLVKRLRGPVALVLVGFAVIGVGFLLLASSSADLGRGFVFVFPFFFFGNMGPSWAIGFAFLFLFLMTLLLTMAASRRMTDWETSIPPTTERLYMPMVGRCPVCGGPLPESASFCPRCGSPIDFKSDQ